MGRTNVVVDDELIEKARQMYGLKTKREVIDFALRKLVRADKNPWEMARKLRGSGWEGDLDQLRDNHVEER